MRARSSYENGTNLKNSVRNITSCNNGVNQLLESLSRGNFFSNFVKRSNSEKSFIPDIKQLEKSRHFHVVVHNDLKKLFTDKRLTMLR